jgi:ketosteroid isomerase-like protein
MSQENVRVVRAAFEALNRRDLDAVFASTAPEFEIDMSRSVGMERGTYDADQWRAVTRGWFDAWESAQWEVAEYIDVGEHVVTPVTNRLRGRAGIEVQARVTWLWTLRDGLVKRLAIYQEPDEALQAAGLSE